MPQIDENIKIRCFCGGEDPIYYKVELLDELNKPITTLEYADISVFIFALETINTELKIYTDPHEIKLDFSKAKLNRFLRGARGSEKIEELMWHLSKINHQNQMCNDPCLHCNPEISSDPMPDFVFGLKNDEST
jgi:hypothetical protein